jgi:nitrate reductase gamma subunit
MDADLRILFTVVPLFVLFVVVLLFALLLVVEGVFARGALNVVVVGEEEDIPLLLLLYSSRSEERVRACSSSKDIFFLSFLSLASLERNFSLLFFLKRNNIHARVCVCEYKRASTTTVTTKRERRKRRKRMLGGIAIR